MRTIIIGDIHGCARTFSALLDDISPDESRDQLILLGDLFDRGPDSWQVWQTVQELGTSFGDRLTVLRGNHEDYWMLERPSLSQLLLHRRVGRQATVRSFRAHGADISECIPWLRQHTLLYWTGEGFQCVHAGVKVEPVEMNDPYTLMHDHSVVLQNTYCGPLTVTGHIALGAPSFFPGEGHPVQELKPRVTLPLPEKGVICIDTGCGKGGALTAMIIEESDYSLRCVPQLDVC